MFLQFAGEPGGTTITDIGWFLKFTTYKFYKLIAMLIAVFVITSFAASLIWVFALPASYTT
jgi:hypothetical protein